MKPCWSGLHQCVVATFQSVVLFFWRKLMNLLRPSITTILQHQMDSWEAGRKGKWYFPWVLICSPNQNNVRWITTFSIFSLDMALFSKRYLGSYKRLLKRWLHLNLPAILARYQLKDIFNADEFDLFYHFQSKRLFYHFQGKRCSVGKHSKVRLTGMAASNAPDEKIPMFVIGKSASPRCFKHVRNLPCRYRSQKMDGWDAFWGMFARARS